MGRKLGLAEAVKTSESLGSRLDSSDHELRANVLLLTANQRVELAIVGLRRLLSDSARERRLEAERKAQQEVEAMHAARKNEIEAEREARYGPSWMYKDPEYDMTKEQAAEFWGLPDDHPARMSWQSTLDKWARQAEEAKALHRCVEDALDRIKEEWRMEWTAELLEQRIAMPDGTATTWGKATIDQHGLRLEMFKTNAVANLEGAARHQQAIADLRAAGASCLNECAKVGA